MIEKFLSYVNHDSMLGFTFALAGLSFGVALYSSRRAAEQDTWRAYAEAQNAILWYIAAILIVLVAK